MHAKKFTVQSMTQGLKQVRETLGADAMIISHKVTPKGIEIIAGVEELKEQALSQTAQVLLGAQSKAKSEQLLDEYKQDKIDPYVSLKQAPKEPPAKMKPKPYENLYSQDQVLNGVQKELENIKQILSTQVSDLCWSQYQLKDAFAGKVAHFLMSHGCTQALAVKAAEQVGNQPTLQLGYQSAVRYLVEAAWNLHQPLTFDKSHYAFVGPAGSGKTKAISKLIPSLLEQFDAKDIGLVAYDEHRLGQFDEIMIYGHIFQIQAQSISDLMALDSALNRFDDKKIVLVDVSTQAIDDFQQTLKHFKQLPFFFELIGVMPSHLEESIFDKWLGCLKAFDAQQILLSKGDETLKKASSLSLMIEHGLSLNQWFNSPKLEPFQMRVTEDTLQNYYRGIYESKE